MWKEALGSLLRRRYNIYSVSPGMLRSVYCPPIPQRWCLIFKTSILPRDLRHQQRNTPQVQNPRASPVRAEGRRSRSASFHLPLHREERAPRRRGGDVPISAAFPEDFNPFSLSLARPAERRGGRRRRERERKKKQTAYYLEEEQCQRPSLDLSTMQRYRLIYLH